MTAIDHESVTAAAVLLVGDPRLRRVAAPASLTEPGLTTDVARLHATLAEFRAEHGFGRAVAATQIGVPRRFIALNLGDGPFTMFNPEIVWRSGETFTLWDDCMSFPFLLVRVARDVSISVAFDDEAGRRKRWDRLDRATSELLQHEIDHLDGVLALDRAADRESIVSREVYESMPEHFARQVDFFQPATHGARPRRTGISGR